MREEITEPKHWRTRPTSTQSWSARRRAEEIALSTDAVDAVFDEPMTYPELVQRIHEQLAVLESQRLQLQQLLVWTDSPRS